MITGATSGIGLAAAEALVCQGAFVIRVGRTAEHCQGAERRLRTILQGMANDLKAEAGAEYCLADLAQQSQVRALATEIERILAGSGKRGLDGLINNAGTFSYWLSLTSEGYETQWAVNHLAPFLLTRLLLPLLQASPEARVITVSSGAYYGVRLNWEDVQLRRHYNGLRAYAQTKLANILFTLEFNRRLESGSSLRAFAVDPGLVKTDIGLKGTPALVRWVWGLLQENRRLGYGILGTLILALVYIAGISTKMAISAMHTPEFLVLNIPPEQYYAAERFFIIPAALAGTILSAGIIRLAAHEWKG